MAGGDRVRERVQQGGPRTASGRGGGPAGAPRPRRALAPGERLAAMSGAALVVLMLFDWFGGRNAWQLKVMDVVLLAIAGFAIAVAVARPAGGEAGRANQTGMAMTVAGGVAVGVMLTLVVESSGGTVPLVLSLVAAVGILGGGLVTLRDGV